MNKAWFFGDSFTDGHGSAPTDKYYQLVGGDTIRWTDIVSKKLNVSQENHGLRGASNENIFESIQTFFSKVNKGDYVFLQSSSPTRQFFFLKNYDVLFKYGSNKVNSRKEEVELWLDPPKKTKDVSLELSEEQHQALVKFITHIRLDASERYMEHYRKQFNFYKSIFSDKECKTVYWDWYEWKNYETIKKATNKLIDDLHWSKKGNADFAEYILNKVKQ